MHRLLPLALLLAAAPLAPAAPPRAVIDGPDQAPPGGSVLLDGRRSANDQGQPLSWRLLNSDKAFLTFDKDGRKDAFCFLPAADPGLYRFALVALGQPDGGTLTADVAIHEVQVGPAPAPAPPAPPPTPPPAPPPAAGKLYASLVTQLPMDPATARLAASPGLAPALAALGCDWKVVGVGSEAFARRNFAPVVQGAGATPALILQDATGRVLAAAKLPATEDEVLAAVRRARGGN